MAEEYSYWDYELAKESVLAGGLSMLLDRAGVKTGMGGSNANKFAMQAGSYYLAEKFVGPYVKPYLRTAFASVPQPGRAVRATNQYLTAMAVGSIAKGKLDWKAGINNVVASAVAQPVARFVGM